MLQAIKMEVKPEEIIEAVKRRLTKKKRMQKHRPSHLIRKRSMRNFLKVSFYWPIKTQKERPGWSS